MYVYGTSGGGGWVGKHRGSGTTTMPGPRAARAAAALVTAGVLVLVLASAVPSQAGALTAAYLSIHAAAGRPGAGGGGAAAPRAPLALEVGGAPRVETTPGGGPIALAKDEVLRVQLVASGAPKRAAVVVGERAFPLQVDAVDDSSDDASEGAVALWVSVPAATLPRSGEHEIAVSVGGGDFGAGVYWHAATVHVPGDSRRSLEGKAPDPFVPAAARARLAAEEDAEGTAAR